MHQRIADLETHLSKYAGISIAIVDLPAAVEFFDKVKGAASEEKIVVCQDHWKRLEQAAKDVVSVIG
jgi:hypothetical protein